MNRKMMAIIMLFIAALLGGLPVIGGFQMAGFHIGMFMFFGLGGLLLFLTN